jgi:hypothetical protein
MDWIALGHAGWLVEVSGLRLLMDPLIAPTHHGGVFDVDPPRTLEAQALRPDFLLVSHAHPDHFDVPSLAELARVDPETVLVTPDPLVAWAGRELGFSTVHEIPAGQELRLDGVVLVTTPSLEPDEWGVAVIAPEGVAFNQVDTVLRTEAQRTVLDQIEALAGRPIDLALVRWQPLLEVAVALAAAPGFPYEDYAEILRQIALLPSGATVVPSAAGVRHRGSCAWMNRFVYPLEEERFLSDAKQLRSGPALSAPLGARLRVADGQVVVLEPAHELLAEVPPPGPARRYDPFGAPSLRDPHPLLPAGRTELERWLRSDLPAALAEAARDLTSDDRPLRFALEVVFESGDGIQATYLAGPGTCVLEPGSSDDYDVLNRITASGLLAVLRRERHWGDVLLGGELRALTRAYRVGPQGLDRVGVAPVFLYYALPYALSVKRAVQRAVEACKPGSEAP